MGWLAVDFDGTLVTWGDGYNRDILTIGEPIMPMVNAVRYWLAQGKDVRIFTARVGPAHDQESHGMGADGFIAYQTKLIQDFCVQQFGVALPVTATKDWHMHKLYDDNAVQMMKNTGVPLESYVRAHLMDVALKLGDPAFPVELERV